MITRRIALVVLLPMSALFVHGCASLQGRDPLQVTVAGIEPLEGQGLEMRLLAKLRVQNPNDAPIDYNGVSVEMAVQGKTFATGVSDTGGSVPRYGESVIAVPVTISAFRMVRQAIDLAQSGGAGKIKYEMKGKLGGSMFGGARFATSGEFEMPTATETAQ